MAYTPVPEQYRKSSIAIATYPYSEIADGMGTVNYLITRVQTDNNSANDAYILITNSGMISEGLNGTNTAVSSATDIDIDLEFNLSKTIEGKCYVTLPVQIPAGITWTSKVTIRKWDGTSETELVAQTTYQSITAGGANNWSESIMQFDIPKTYFKAGDIFRINFAGTASAGSLWLYHDPQGTTSDFTITGGTASVLVPFILDI